MSHALIVEDDIETAKAMAELVMAENFTAARAGTLREAQAQIALQHPDIVLVDLQLPDGTGLDLLKDPQLLAESEVVLITGHASLETSVQALRLGAADYLVKPINFKHLRGILSRVMRPATLQAEVESLNAEVEASGHFGHLWGRSAPMRAVYQQIGRVAGTSVTVLLTGESGTGKEVVARAIHDLSRRRSKPFLAVNCGAISPNLVESEIFGHEKGSFTGADRQHLGFFERASGGTLFLDEVTEMLPELQVKLLRVLETGTFMRVGSTQVQEGDVRVIAATNRSPLQAIASGKLREDLYYRLSVFPLALPPLRERREDIELLAQHFLQEIGRREGEVKHFTPQAIARLSEYHWPGNVRELRNVVQRAYVMSGDHQVTDQWLPGVAPTATTQTPLPADGAAERLPSVTVPMGSSMAEVEKALILATLAHFGHHKERTAAVLGISLKTLYNRLRIYALDKPEDSPSEPDPGAGAGAP